VVLWVEYTIYLGLDGCGSAWRCLLETLAFKAFLRGGRLD
jgi:hypothetical protein